MATKFIFNGKTISLPGAYSVIKAGFKNPPGVATYGNVLIIDTGLGATWGGGAGIAGTLANGKDAIYLAEDIEGYTNYQKGGLLWKLANAFYYPNGAGSRGVSQVFMAKAAATVPARISFTFHGASPVTTTHAPTTTVAPTTTLAPTTTAHTTTAHPTTTLAPTTTAAPVTTAGLGGGVFVSQVKDEGIIGNGVEGAVDLLTKGYAARMVAGSLDLNKFKIQFYLGSYKGMDPINLIPYDGVALADTVPQLLVESVEFSNMSELVAWANTDATYNYYFKLMTGTVTGSGLVTSTDMDAYPGNTLAAGGTETYNTTHLDTLLDSITDLDFSIVFVDKYADNAMGTENGMIFTWLKNDAKYGLHMIIGGGYNNAKFTQALGSIPIAQYYNDQKVITVHGGVKKISTLVGGGFLTFDSLYKAALVCGRMANLAPQVPLTFKALDFDAEVHSLNEKDQLRGLNAGVLCTKYDSAVNAFVILQGVNTLQRNTNFINDDGTSASIQIMRIADQLNKEIVINARVQLLGQEDGVNRNTLSEKNVADWVAGYLTRRTASTTADNLILSFQDITVSTVDDAYFCTYKFTPNTEITKLFFTGFMLK